MTGGAWSKYSDLVDKVDCVREGEISVPSSFLTDGIDSLNNTLRAQSTLSTVLPSACPAVTNRFLPGVMECCRFSEMMLAGLVADGIMPTESGCPFFKSCRLICQLETWQPGGKLTGITVVYDA